MFKSDGTLDLQGVVRQAARGFITSVTRMKTKNFRLESLSDPIGDVIQLARHENRAICLAHMHGGMRSERCDATYKNPRGLIIPFMNPHKMPKDIPVIGRSTIDRHAKNNNTLARIDNTSALLIPEKFIVDSGLYDVLDEIMRHKHGATPGNILTQTEATLLLDAYYVHSDLSMDGKFDLGIREDRTEAFNKHREFAIDASYRSYSVDFEGKTSQEIRKWVTERYDKNYNELYSKINKNIDAYIHEVESPDINAFQKPKTQIEIPKSEVVERKPQKSGRMVTASEIRTVDVSLDNVVEIGRAVAKAQAKKSLEVLQFPDRDVFLIADRQLTSQFNPSSQTADLATLFSLADRSSAHQTICLQHRGSLVVATNNASVAHDYLQAESIRNSVLSELKNEM